MLGYAFMGMAHSNAFKKLPYMMYPPAAIPHPVAQRLAVMVTDMQPAGIVYSQRRIQPHAARPIPSNTKSAGVTKLL